MNEFKVYHPIVNFIYFIFVIGFSCVLMHPLCLVISLVCGFTYSVMLKGREAIKRNLIYMLPVLILMALINPAFNHRGVTILKYLPGGNPLTLESIVYGLAAAVMLASVILWFSCFNMVITSDKFIYLFGKIIPSMSLIISMTLRFVPRFAAQLKEVANAQKGMGREVTSGSAIRRARHGLNILSIMTTWSLENAIETSDSMRSRGYGIPGRTAFSIFTFDKRDKNALICIVLLGTYTLIGNISGRMYFRYFPGLKGAGLSAYGISVFASYLLLCIYPVIIELWEARKWKALESKI